MAPPWTVAAPSAVFLCAWVATANPPLARAAGAIGGRATSDASSLPALARHPVSPAPPIEARPAPASEAATPPTSLRVTRHPPPFAFGLLLNPAATALSILVNRMAVVSPLLLLGTGRAACLLVPQAYASTRHGVGGAGAQVGFRVFSRLRYDGLYFGVRFGGGVGNQSFKTFMGEMDAGWMWAFGAFRLGVGVNAGGGYYAYEGWKGSLYLFSLDLSLGFAFGRLDGSTPKR